ncbi:MAG TPA: alkaline phosphatase D family protein [bacterium]|nr:alkaline phosphatase D family protein [bacterium]
MRTLNRIRTTGVLLVALFLVAPVSAQTTITFPQGIASGDVTDTRAVIWARTSVPASLRVEYGTSQALGTVWPAVVATTAETDLTGKVDLRTLQPGTTYSYRVVAASGDQRGASLVGTFTTAPAPTAAADVTFAWSADMSERFRPFAIFDAIRSRNPEFFLFLGDTVYTDIDCDARTLPAYRACSRRNREDEAFLRFARATSIYAVWDDHEVANNFDASHDRLAVGRQVFLEYWPVRPADEPGRMYRSFRWGQLLELFMLDTRQYRSPPFQRDTVEKTMLGAAQKQWLLRGLAASPARFKVIASSVPLKYHGADSWDGYTTERQEIFDFIVKNGVRRVVFLTADVHYAAVLRYKEGIVEAISGPLAAIISSRRRAAGEPETEFSFNSSFTFGLVRVTAGGLIIEIYDVTNRLLHRTTVAP